TAQHRAEAGEQRAGRRGRGHGGGSAQRQADHRGERASPGGHQEHRNAGPSAQRRADSGTRQPRQQQSEQDEGGAGPGERGESGRTSGH
ncbi:hypothetical protein C3R30_21865, partial [Mycobacterium tuberculosis]